MSDPKSRTLPAVGESLASVVEIIEPRAADLIDPAARLTRLTGGGVWAEGPVYLPGDDVLLYSDVRADLGMGWSDATGGEIRRSPNDHTNGQTLDREGRVLHCEHANRRVARTEADGTRVGLVDHFEGRRLNSPNDIVVKSDGTIWFTDPPYGIVLPEEGTPAPQEQAGCFVFRFEPRSGELSVVTDAIIHPNGLAFSPDESLLYVSDTSASLDPRANHHIVVLDVVDGHRLTRPRVFKVMEPGFADGLRVDDQGNVWSSAGDGVHVIGPDGADLARVFVPEVTANCVFGGVDGRRLFITASSSLYAIETKVTGSGVAARVSRTAQASPAGGSYD